MKYSPQKNLHEDSRQNANFVSIPLPIEIAEEMLTATGRSNIIKAVDD